MRGVGMQTEREWREQGVWKNEDSFIGKQQGTDQILHFALNEQSDYYIQIYTQKALDNANWYNHTRVNSNTGNYGKSTISVWRRGSQDDMVNARSEVWQQNKMLTKIESSRTIARSDKYTAHQHPNPVWTNQDEHTLINQCQSLAKNLYTIHKYTKHRRQSP